MTTTGDEIAAKAAEEFIEAMKGSEPWTDECWLCEEPYDEYGAVDQGLCFGCAWTCMRDDIEERKSKSEPATATDDSDDDDIEDAEYEVTVTMDGDFEITSIDAEETADGDQS